MRVLLAVIILLLSVPAGAGPQPTLRSRLTADVSRNLVSPDQEILYRAYALYAPERLPAAYAALDRSGLIKGASPEALVLAKSLPLVSEAVQKELADFMARPTGLPLVIETDHFKIHYTETGPDAISAAMKDSAGIILEYCWDLEINQLGFPQPPVDNASDPKYDVYLMDQTSYYGWSQPEPPDYRTSYMVLDNDYSEFQTAGLNGMKVTVAHEFFHAIHFDLLWQSTMTSDEYIPWMEMSAVWMEDMAFDHINDYYNYLRFSSGGVPPWFRVPHYSVVKTDYWHEYGSCLYLMFLSEKYSPDVVKALWQQIGVQDDKNGVELMDEVLSGYYGTDFNTSLVDFSIWNWFTGSRADTANYYSEGDSFPEVMVDSTYHYHDLSADLNRTWPLLIPNKPERYGANFIILDNVQVLDTSSVLFADSGNTSWRVGMIRETAGGSISAEHMGMLGGLTGSYQIDDPSQTRKIVLAITRVDGNGTGEYVYKIGGPVAGLSIGRTDGPETLSVAHTVVCSAFALGGDGSIQGLANAVWTVSDTSVADLGASVGSYVTLTPRQPGNIVITALSEDSLHADTITYVFTEIPPAAEVLQAFPNPFYAGTDHTMIVFPFAGVRTESDITINIFSYSGKRVKTITAAGPLPADFYQSPGKLAAAGLVWDGRNASGELVATGLYYYNMQLGENKVSTTRKFSVIRKKK